MHPALPLFAAFLLGSLPTGFLVGKYLGVDIRTLGSGNIGTTNIGRMLGKRAGLVTFSGDLLKGLLAVVALRSAVNPTFLALAAVTGHCFSPFLRFRGGKGVATAFGAFLGLAPLAATASFLAFLLVVWWTRYVSLGSIVGALLFPLLYLSLPPRPLLWDEALAVIAVSTTILIRHRSNIRRLRQGSERQLKAAPPSTH
jgi:glycerol-3-phosphate acyltransferase PlsY